VARVSSQNNQCNYKKLFVPRNECYKLNIVYLKMPIFMYLNENSIRGTNTISKKNVPQNYGTFIQNSMI